MKQLIKPIRKNIAPIKLYLNDIATIHNILKQNAKNIIISTDTYEVEDIEQLRDLEEKKGHYLLIKCREPYIVIEFRPYQAEIYFAEDTISNRGILSKIEDILQKRVVTFGRFLTSKWAYFSYVGIFILTVIIAYISGYSFSDHYMWLPFVLISFLFVTIGLIIAWFLLKSYSTIIYMDKKEESSFWKRNKDRIIVGIIIAILGAIIGSIITKLLT